MVSTWLVWAILLALVIVFWIFFFTVCKIPDKDITIRDIEDMKSIACRNCKHEDTISCTFYDKTKTDIS